MENIFVWVDSQMKAFPNMDTEIDQRLFFYLLTREVSIPVLEEE